MTQSIIVYRNPLEQQFWESGMLFPLICGVILSVTVSVGIAYCIERTCPWHSSIRKHSGPIVLGSAVATMLAVLWAML